VDRYWSSSYGWCQIERAGLAFVSTKNCIDRVSYVGSWVWEVAYLMLRFHVVLPDPTRRQLAVLVFHATASLWRDAITGDWLKTTRPGWSAG